MEEGSLRCDANVSVRPRGQKEFGTKAEVKNVNSFRFIREALEYEIERQIEVSDPAARSCRRRASTTPTKGKTYAMRTKERAHDYRYFPEPDLLPLVVDEAWRSEIAPHFPELPRPAPALSSRNTASPSSDAAMLTATQALRRSIRDRGRKAAKIPSASPTWCRAS